MMPPGRLHTEGGLTLTAKIRAVLTKLCDGAKLAVYETAMENGTTGKSEVEQSAKGKAPIDLTLDRFVR